MSTRYPKWLRFTLAGSTLAVISTIAVLLLLPTWRVHSLRRSCAGGDRIVVDANPWPINMRGKHQPTMPTYEIAGKDKGAGLLDAIEFERGSSQECKCMGDMMITIHRGDAQLAELSIQHEKKLRWRDGDWSGDQPLTEAGRKAVTDFLVANGCTTPDEARMAFREASESQFAPP